MQQKIAAMGAIGDLAQQVINGSLELKQAKDPNIRGSLV